MGSSESTTPVQEYDVGTYRELKRRSRKGDQLDIHHLIQKEIGLALIPDYNENDGICIALHESKHRQIPTLRKSEIQSLLGDRSPRQILAYDIWRNKTADVIPNPILLKAIELHCRNFRDIYGKPNPTTWTEKNNTIDCGGEELIRRFRLEINPQFGDKVEDFIKHGNCVKDLPYHIRQFLKEGAKERRVHSSQSQNLGGKYVIHRDTNPLTGQARSLTIRIEFDHSETHEEGSGDHIVVVTTHYYNVIVSYE